MADDEGVLDLSTSEELRVELVSLGMSVKREIDLRQYLCCETFLAS